MWNVRFPPKQTLRVYGGFETAFHIRSAGRPGVAQRRRPCLRGRSSEGKPPPEGDLAGADSARWLRGCAAPREKRNQETVRFRPIARLGALCRLRLVLVCDIPTQFNHSKSSCVGWRGGSSLAFPGWWPSPKPLFPPANGRIPGTNLGSNLANKRWCKGMRQTP